jgi:formamidopyrimidine-DNA glycosylase
VPELPEVETIRRQLAPLVSGRRLVALEIEDPRWCRPLTADELSSALVGRRIAALGRRGKYLVWELEPDSFLLMHLRMTGTLLYDAAPDAPYRRVRLRLGDGHEVTFCDPRRFGTGELALGRPALEAFLGARLGIEPLGPQLTGDRLAAIATGRRAPIKAFLLDQRHVAGIGNIYADEALFRAGIHPLQPAGSLRRSQYAALADALRAALTAGILAGGATIDDFRHVDGVRGAFQDEFLVHRRGGEPCRACGGEVVRFVAAGRGTYACERCQKRPRGSAGGAVIPPRHGGLR